MPILFLYLALGIRCRITLLEGLVKYVTIGVIMLNIVARGIVFVFSFYAFAHLPADVYQQIEWSQFFPFIS